MKRAKARTFASDKTSEDDDSYFAKPKEPSQKWEDIADKPDSAFTPYSLTSRFAKGALIAHSKFGKGFVLSADATSIQVVFKDGPKKLGHSAV